MVIIRDREWRIFMKHHWIKKRLENHHEIYRKRRRYFQSVDINNIKRRIYMFQHTIGGYEYKMYKSGGRNRGGGFRYGKKRFKEPYCYNEWYSDLTRNRLFQKKEMLKILIDEGIT